MKRSSNKEHKINTYDLLDRLVDGRIIDEGELYDRLIISNQLGVFFPITSKQASKRVR